MSANKDRLVHETEKAALAEAVQFYPSGAGTFGPNAAGGEDKHKGGKKK